jgi:NAD(P)-dependent dehydrogenase (short-subunit alcohol dehydrogenase family)
MSEATLRFDGRVAIVTGAGRNLGREYALALAERGASVVVNDLGVGLSDTDGRAVRPDRNPADDVVDEIVDRGGRAVANHDSVSTVEGGRSIVECALDCFGRVDVVINNAGQVRMAEFGDFPDESVDALVDTQLRGVLNVSRPAWKHMAANGGGRFVNVSSGAAFGGVPGGAVYAMAKMGSIGLTFGMASEGRPLGISSNVIVPYAKTRPGTGFGPIPWSEELGQWLDPALVAPLVVWLSHDTCSANGEVFGVGAGWQAAVTLRMARGYSARDLTPESIAANQVEMTSGGEESLTPFRSPAMKHLLSGFEPPHDPTTAAKTRN